MPLLVMYARFASAALPHARSASAWPFLHLTASTKGSCSRPLQGNTVSSRTNVAVNVMAQRCCFEVD